MNDDKIYILAILGNIEHFASSIRKDQQTQMRKSFKGKKSEVMSLFSVIHTVNETENLTFPNEMRYDEYDLEQTSIMFSAFSFLFLNSSYDLTIINNTMVTAYHNQMMTPQTEDYRDFNTLCSLIKKVLDKKSGKKI